MKGIALRLAVFTNEFPSRVSTFFSSDMAALIAKGIDVEIFPLYPVRPELWKYVPDSLDESVLPRNKVHGMSPGRCLRALPAVAARHPELWRPITASARQFGLQAVCKSSYAAAFGAVQADVHAGRFDAVLAYWGNYAATAAYAFRQLAGGRIPFWFFLHAGTDLYRTQVFMREKLRAATGVVVVCEFNRTFLGSLYPDLYPQMAHKIHLHHIGLDLGKFEFRRDGLPNQIIAVGRFAANKGFAQLVEAIAVLRQRGMDVKLALVGDGEERSRLMALARKLAIQDLVAFRGWLPPSEVALAIQQSSVLVHPSPGIGDAVPTVIKEAMAAGTPVIGSAVAGIPELLDGGRCGVLLKTTDPESIAEAVQSLLADPVRQDALAHAARRRAEDLFDMWCNGAALADLLRVPPASATSTFLLNSRAAAQYT